MTQQLSYGLTLTLAILLLAPAAASGSETHFIVNGLSHHIDSSYDWNENHAGLGLERVFSPQSTWSPRVSANAFLDSNEEMSYMVGGGLHRRLLGTERFGGLELSAGLTAFLMTRSDVNGNQPFPGILPSLTLGNRHYGINLTYLPVKAVESMTNSFAADPTLDGIVFMQFRVNLSQFSPTSQ